MSRPTLHVVVHHRFDPDKPYDNLWNDDCLRLEKFETTHEVAIECDKALKLDAWVYVHRCALPPFRPTVACRAKVTGIETKPGERPRVLLGQAELIDKRALHKPAEGHNHYYSDVPSWSD